jgi:UDP-perosamine 4-acetyltransferase
MPTLERADCVILGGGGHAAVVIDALRSAGSEDRLVVLDADESKWGEHVLEVPVLGGDELLMELIARGTGRFVVGLGGTGDNLPRRALFEKGIELGLQPMKVIHAAAFCSSWAELGAGSVVLPGAVVNARASLGVNVIVNSSAAVEHDCRIGDHVHIATGARLAASTRVGACAHVGVGAVVRQGITIGEAALVGAGAVVVKDVPPGATVVGVPAGLMTDRSGAV